MGRHQWTQHETLENSYLTKRLAAVEPVRRRTGIDTKVHTLPPCPFPPPFPSEGGLSFECDETSVFVEAANESPAGSGLIQSGLRKLRLQQSASISNQASWSPENLHPFSLRGRGGCTLKWSELRQDGFRGFENAAKRVKYEEVKSPFLQCSAPHRLTDL